MAYYLRGRHRRYGFSQSQTGKDWRAMLAILAVIFVVLAGVNGFSKSFKLGKYLGKSGWDSQSSFSIALDTNPPAVFIYQKDPKRIVFATLDANSYFESGKLDAPIEKIKDVQDKKSGKDLSRLFSLSFRGDIENYIIFNQSKNLDKQESEKLFKNLAAITAPLAILAPKPQADIKDTNIARIDMIKLWWQLKGLSLNQLDLVDLGSLKTEVINAKNEKVLGVDDISLNHQIAKYLENPQVRKDEYKIKIKNASGYLGAGYLAADFAQAIGASVISAETADQVSENTLIITGSGGYTPDYLAKIFKCDIKVASENDNREITVIIGRDFAVRYFE